MSDLDPPSPSPSPSPSPPSLHIAHLPSPPSPSSSSSSSSPHHDSAHDLLSVSFNQDHGCFACGTKTGFRIFNCQPFKRTFKRDFPDGGIAMVEMLFRCNILALVGGGEKPLYPPNKVMIWDDQQNRCIGELSFRSEVRAVRLRRDRIVVVLEHKIYIYHFSDLKLLHQIETIPNARGICELSSASDSVVLACVGLHRGQVRVEHYGSKKTKFIPAHDSHIACLALTPDGSLLATASSKGTLVRIFNSLDGSKLREVRRGADSANIYSIAFSSTAQWLALSSDKGTVHVFSLKAPTGNDEPKQSSSGPPNGGGVGLSASSSSTSANNPSSTLAFMKGVLPKYFSSEWSFAQFRIPEHVKTLVGFGADKTTVVIVGLDGSFYRCAFDPIHGGEMQQLEFARFLKPDNEM